MGTNDAEQEKKDAIRAEVAQMNVQAVVGKLQDFEARLAAQDGLIADLHSKVVALEVRLNVQMNLEAMAARFGSGPTT